MPGHHGQAGEVEQMNSRSKGKRGELEAAKEWARVVGGEARRGQQFSGGKDSPDVVTSFRRIHLEVKRTERGNPYDWIEQAVSDGVGKIPCVLHRRSQKPWLLIVRLDDVPGLSQEIAQAAEAVGRGAVPGGVPDTGVHKASGEDAGAPRVL